MIVIILQLARGDAQVERTAWGQENNQTEDRIQVRCQMIDIVEMSVLIADDMPNMITTIRGMMKFLNFGKRFVPAADGEEAWRLLKKDPEIDLAIMDFNMPHMNGAEVLSRLREDRELRDLPVIMVTAQANQEFVAEAAESEIDAYILKPATVKVLGDKVLSVIENANNPSPMVFHLKEARSYEDVGDLDAAIEEARLAVDANPSSSRPLRELGYYYYKQEDLKEAKKWLTKAAKMNSLDVIAFHYLGKLYARINDIEMASKCFEKAMNISPRHVSRAVSFGKTLIDRKMIQEGIQVFERALALAGNNAELREQIATYCIDNGANEYGAKLLEAIIRNSPNRLDLCYQLGVALVNHENFSKALAYLNRVDVEEKGNLAAKKYIALAYIGVGKPIRAEKVIKEILDETPDDQEALELLRRCA